MHYFCLFIFWWTSNQWYPTLQPCFRILYMIHLNPSNNSSTPLIQYFFLQVFCPPALQGLCFSSYGSLLWTPSHYYGEYPCLGLVVRTWRVSWQPRFYFQAWWESVVYVWRAIGMSIVALLLSILPHCSQSLLWEILCSFWQLFCWSQKLISLSVKSWSDLWKQKRETKKTT